MRTARRWEEICYDNGKNVIVERLRYNDSGVEEVVVVVLRW